VKLYTIGFTKTTAQSFFSRLNEAGVWVLIDTRLHRDGQLSGFAKAVDLAYFLEKLTLAKYTAEALLAPTDQILKAYQSKKMTWESYEEAYRALLTERKIVEKLSLVEFDQACLLCSEHQATRCHRRLAAEYVRTTFPGGSALDIIHL
jgi:uncharacterized protein (DUF488 family)